MVNKIRNFLISFIIFFSLLIGYSYSAILSPGPLGSIDNSFSIGGGFDGIINAIVLQPDGKILVGGDFINYNGTNYNNIIRLNSDGSIDTSFTIGQGFNKVINAISLQSDGKIVIGGDFGSYDGINYNNIVRLNSDGTIDNSFTISGGFDGLVNAIELQGDGKIVIGGDFRNYDGISIARIIRLNSDGRIDNSFTIGGGFDGLVNTIELQSDGKILVGGNFTEYDSITTYRIARLNSDGRIDNSFTIGGGFDDPVNTIELQSDGKILVGGDFQFYDGIINSRRIARLHNDGSIDTGFSIGQGFDGPVKSIELQGDGKTLVGGTFQNYNETNYNNIVRLNNDGSTDNSFTIGGGFDDPVKSIQIQSDGKILVGGNFGNYGGMSSTRIIRLYSELGIDMVSTTDDGLSDIDDITTITMPIFTGGCIDNNPVDISVSVSGGIVLYDSVSCIMNSYTYQSFSLSGGSYIITGVQDRITILSGMIMTGGQLDTGFTIGGGFDGLINAIELQGDGKMLVGGDFTEYDGVASLRIIRLNSDGSIDTGFSIGQGFDGPVKSIELQGDGKILVGGNFSTYDGLNSSNIARLNDDGSIDTGFSIGQGFNGKVHTITIQPDGKILVGGDFTQSNGVAITQNIARLNNDGSNDLLPGQGFDGLVNAIEVQSDGKILVGGDFKFYDSTNSFRIARLNDDGSIDTNFLVGQGFNGSVNTIELQSGGKIVIGGNFTEYDVINSPYIVTLNDDGSIDNNFSIGGGFDGLVNAIKIQPDGKILVGGGFTQYNNITTPGIVLLYSDGIIDRNFLVAQGFNGPVNAIEIQSDEKILVGGNFNDYNSINVSHISRLDQVTLEPMIWTGNQPSLHAMSFRIVEPLLPPLVTTPYGGQTFNTGTIIATGDCIYGTTIIITGDNLLQNPTTGLCMISNTFEIPLLWSGNTSLGNLTFFTMDNDIGISSGSMISGLIIDTIAPIIPSILSIGGDTIAPYITDDITPTLLGTGEAGSIIYAIINGIVYTGIVNSSGYWNITINSGLIIGTYSISIYSRDSIGNISLVLLTDLIINITINPIAYIGGGGGGLLFKDVCPNGDYTSSFFDNNCGKRPEILSGNVDIFTGKIIVYTPMELYNDSITNEYCYKRKSNINIIDSSDIITTNEFKKAINFLYAYNMTIFNDIDKFFPYSNLTREQAAKIFSNFAMNVLCRKPDKNLNINYTDINNANESLKPYISLAYQLGLMKGGSDGLFRSKDNITKAEFNAVLIRLLLKSYLLEDITDNWYSEYNKVSTDLNIIKYDANLNAITRHDASLMLFRAYKDQIFSLKKNDYDSFVLKNSDDYIN